jgi:hypothetical protein
LARKAASRASRHAKDADLAALVAAGRSDVPLVQMKWRCGNSGSGLTKFVVGGSHMRRVTFDQQPDAQWVRSIR